MAFLYYFLMRLIQAYLFLVSVYALMSWFPGAYATGFGRWLSRLIEPVWRPFRRLPLQFMGLDFSLLAVLLCGLFLMRLLTAIFLMVL
ncbi:YggT family protein [Streptococcus sp. DD12]|uniref:YggT family protein n=1 Tax=Streptococcus sp. DD12 TaxID=1777880 RepID=UPI000798180E|nr:YggT family protein [Streptococcus sp. DD12]KXT75754.1 putative cell division protein YlmG/Ycf19, YggT family [Streptococcus sp. DD12]